MWQVALVKWTESVGLALVERDLTSLCLETPDGQSLRYDILQIFPFTSETKRMGIIVRVRPTQVWRISLLWGWGWLWRSFCKGGAGCDPFLQGVGSL